MFFIGIFGIQQASKALDYNKTTICTACGRFGNIFVYYSYTYFHFFFIPLFRWNKHFYVKMNCCGTLYELNTEKGNKIMKGNSVQILEGDLILLNKKTSRASCPECGFNLSDEFTYCPKCGTKI